MKCATCGEPTQLLRLEDQDEYTATRTYCCAFDHYTHTVEVLPTAVDKRARTSAEAAAATRADRWHRDQAILRDLRTMSSVEVAERHGVTDARVRQILDTVPLVQGPINASLRTPPRKRKASRVTGPAVSGITSHRIK